MNISTNESQTFLGAISVSARRQSLDEFEHQTFIIEKKLEGAGLTTQRSSWSTCRYVGQQPGCNPVDITVMVYGDERSCSHNDHMIGLGEKFDLDHVLLLTGDDGKFELHGTSKRRHAYPGYGSIVAISRARMTDADIDLTLPKGNCTRLIESGRGTSFEYKTRFEYRNQY